VNEEKKIWFRGVTRRLWIPIAWEGWALLAASAAIVLGAFYLAGGRFDRSIPLGENWWLLLVIAANYAGFYWIGRSRVRY